MQADLRAPAGELVGLRYGHAAAIARSPKISMSSSAIIRSGPGPVRIAGTGHSFTPLVKNDGTILSLDRFEGLRSHDPAS